MTVRIPAEWEPHVCCWMAWAVHPEWEASVNRVKDELEAVVHTVSQFEPVRLLTPPNQLPDARARFKSANVEIIAAPVDDIWMRDIAPTFALRDGEVVAIDFNFNSWGNTAKRRARPGDRLAATAHAIFGVPHICAPFIAEGGAFITDGEGTVLTTESCLLNHNRNPFGSKREQTENIERAFQEFGIRRVIWLEGDSSEAITSGHIDGYAMFTAPGALLVEIIDTADAPTLRRRARDIATLYSSTDAVGRQLRVERVRAPRSLEAMNEMFAACYVNAYVANGAVIAACFNDPERDAAAQDAFESSFPGRKIKMIRIDHIAAGGGGIHCLTQPMPRGGST